MCDQLFDVVVVGGGIMGACAAYYVSKEKRSVVVLEQFDFLHRRGSSHGDSRIIRYTYIQDYFTHMMFESYRLWDEIQANAGVRLLTTSGGIDIGPKTGRDMQSLLKACARHKIPITIYDPKRTLERFHVSIPDDNICVHQEDAGVLNATKSVATILSLAAGQGAILKDNHKVTHVNYSATDDKGDPIVIVTTNRGVFRCRRVIVCPGAWASPLLASLGVHPRLSVIQVFVSYFKTKRVEDSGIYDLANGMTTFIEYDSDTSVATYGLPGMEYPGLFKLALHHGHEVTADSRTFEPDQKLFNEKLKPYVEKRFPYLDPTPVSQDTCMYTMTPDENFIIDTLPGAPNVVIGAAGNGHAFKLGPMIGKMLAELALRGTCTYDNTEFLLTRPALRPAAKL